VRPGAEVNPKQVAMTYRLDARDKAVVEAAGNDASRTAMATLPARAAHDPQG
jgi:hypothetical protein